MFRKINHFNFFDVIHIVLDTNIIYIIDNLGIIEMLANFSVGTF